MNTSRKPVTIYQEVPGVEPQWFVSGGPFGYPFGDPPMFATEELAREFCAAQGFTDVPSSYFEA